MRTLCPALLSLLLAWPLAARADLFSPGPLSRPHQALEGLRNCTKCHEEGHGLSQQKCLGCHTELQPEIASHTGFHGRMADAARECQSCHHEHQGKTFALIDWGAGGEKAFAHGKVGWPLEGKHAEVKCQSCHDRRLVVDKAVLALLDKQPTRHTFLGLSTKCSACHFDEHRGQLGSDCARCHTPSDWKKTPGFHHESTDFPLTGKHRTVACERCHAPKRDTTTAKSAFPAPKSETFLTLSRVPHDGCESCHADPHGGKFAQRCEACHVTDGWLKVKDASLGKSFHDKTRFPLRGLHADVACKACHGPFPGQRAKFKGLAFARCSDCHADAHEGQLATLSRGRAPDCDACHGVEGFRPARFSLADHAKSPFALEGAHQAVPCDACHPARPDLLQRVPGSVRTLLARRKRKPLFSDALFVMGGKLDRCETCHRDPHAGQFDQRVARSGCTGCHTLTSFHALSFDHARDTRYPLEGPHAKAACAACHRPDDRGIVQYANTSTACQSCHADPHCGQFAVASGRTDCARCHTVTRFQDAPGFRHAPPFTAFALDGAHAKVECTSCHGRVELTGTKVQKFVGLPTTCAGCHQDFHHGAFQEFSP